MNGQNQADPIRGMMKKALELTLERLRELSFDATPISKVPKEVKQGARAGARNLA